MKDVIKKESEGLSLLGFIDGTVQAPPKTVITSVNAPNTIHEERENEEYVAWKRLDDLVREMILKYLSQFTTKQLSSLNTAKELWEDIARRAAEKRVDHYRPLYKAVIEWDWDAAKEITMKEPDAVREGITLDSETALIVAVRAKWRNDRVKRRNDFVEKLVEKMSSDDLTICDDGGRTALHRAAGFGNVEVAKLLVEKNPALRNMETHSKETPMFYAAERGDRKMVEWLLEEMKTKGLEWLKGDPGFRVLYQLTHSELYDIALTMLKYNPELAYFIPEKEEDLKFHALNALAEKTSSFKSGNNFNFLQKLIYSSMGSVGSKNLTCICHQGGEWRLQTNGTFLYQGGTCRRVLINNSSQLDELRKKICTELKIDSQRRLFFYNTMRDKTKYVNLNDQNAVTMLFHLNGDNVDVFVEEEGHATDSTRESNVFDNSQCSHQEMGLGLPENASNIVTGMGSVGSKNLTCCHWGGKWRLQTNGTFLYYGGTRKEVLINNSSQLDELCKKICTALQIDSQNKLFFYNTKKDKTKYVKLNDQKVVTMLFHYGDSVDVFVEEEGHATDSTRESNVLDNNQYSHQEMGLVLPENANNILTGIEKFQITKNEGMELKNIADNGSRGDIEAPPASNNSGVTNDNRSRRGDAEAPSASNNFCAANVTKRLHPMFRKVGENCGRILDELHYRMDQLLIKPIREIREKKKLHRQAHDLLGFLCREATNSNFSKSNLIFRLPLEKATSMGIHEIVEEISSLYPYAVFLENDRRQTIFQQAIVSRQEKVFNLIHKLEESKAIVLSKRDSLNNNALHLAGYVERPQLLYFRAGAALQMQRELQWFQEVERLVLPKNREERNDDDNKTPAEVFSIAHKELLKEGERWMKDTANSCTIVASLIATVAFAAAIQVPGGNNDIGRPIFNQQTAFTIFGISNSLALFSSIASVIMFLSILTSPCAEKDFLSALPNRLIIGLVSIFFSILCTMVAFGAILYLVFGENKPLILILVVAFGCYPSILFWTLQYPLLKDMIKSTYFSGIFLKRRFGAWSEDEVA